jgi:hypothetical protein
MQVWRSEEAELYDAYVLDAKSVPLATDLSPADP